MQTLLGPYIMVAIALPPFYSAGGDTPRKKRILEFKHKRFRVQA